MRGSKFNVQGLKLCTHRNRTRFRLKEPVINSARTLCDQCLKVLAACANFPIVTLTVSVKKTTHRGDAEAAEKRIFDHKILQTLRTQCLCGEYSFTVKLEGYSSTR